MVIVAVLVVIGAATSGGGSSTSVAPDAGSSASSAASAEPTPSGQTLDFAGTRYQVTSVRTAARVGGRFFREPADGTFVIVSLELTNLKHDTRTILDTDLVARDAQGRRFDPDSDAELAMAGQGLDDDLVMQDIQPGLPTRGTEVYDVPADALPGLELQVTDLDSGRKALMLLGP